MEKGKIIVIEGTDCSGKETQSKMLEERLNNEGIKTIRTGFPNYESPSGKIVGLSYLGKPYLARELIDSVKEKVYDRLSPYAKTKHDNLVIDIVIESIAEELSHGWFPEGAPNVDPIVSAYYYAADRLYNLPFINEQLENGINVILDRYVYSNLGHQGGKYSDPKIREKKYEELASLEFGFSGLPEADAKMFLHMPTAYAQILKGGRKEEADENERDINHLINAENAFIEVASKFNFDVVNCVYENHSETPIREDIKTPNEIHEEVFDIAVRKLTLK